MGDVALINPHAALIGPFAALGAIRRPLKMASGTSWMHAQCPEFFRKNILNLYMWLKLKVTVFVMECFYEKYSAEILWRMWCV